MFAVLLNRASGAAASNDARERIEHLFHERGREAHVYEVQTSDALTRAARDALESGHEAIVAAGGDGTVNAVATLVAGRPTPLGVLPLGTLNHFAKDLGIPLALDRAVQTVVDGHVARVDAGRVSDRIFLNNCSIGIYPDIVERREALRKLGRRKWIALLLATREVLQRGDEILIRLASGPQMISAQTPFLFVGNNEYLCEGIKIGARTRLDAGRLCAYFAPPVHTRELPKLFVSAVLGRARHGHVLETVAAEEFWVDTPRSRTMKVACDGEILMLTPPVHFCAWPGALAVMTPGP